MSDIQIWDKQTTDTYAAVGRINWKKGDLRIDDAVTGRISQWDGSNWQLLSRGDDAVSIGGTVLNPTAKTITVGIVPSGVAYTITNIKAFQDVGTGSVINFSVNGTNVLTSNFTITSAGAWIDAGTVNNISIPSGATVSLVIVSVSGSPTIIGIEAIVVRA